MRPDDVARMALRNVRNRGLRSGLTVLGIVIGVAAVVALIALGQGLGAAVTSQLGGLGGQSITVTPGGSRTATVRADQTQDAGSQVGVSANLTAGDERVVRAVPGVALVDGIVSSSQVVTFRGERTRLTAQGVEPVAWSRMLTTSLEAGRRLVDGDGSVAVLGAATAHDVFSHPVAVNDVIVVGGTAFRVVGILDPAGGFGQADRALIVPAHALRQVLGDTGSDTLSSIAVLAADGQDVAKVASGIDGALLAHRHRTAETRDFAIITAQQIADTINTVLGSITVFLGAIAAVSLLVGGIGIANTMFMAVIERSRQIGILKALGSSNADVAGIFVTEAGVLGLLGGAVGLAVGWAMGQAVTAVGIQLGPPGARSVGLQLAITPVLAFGAIAFAVGVGLASGVLPALRAARLDPVETLRAE